MILVGWTVCRRNIWEEIEYKNSFVGASVSYFKRSTLKSPRRKTDSFSLEIYQAKYLDNYHWIHLDLYLDAYTCTELLLELLGLGISIND